MVHRGLLLPDVFNHVLDYLLVFPQDAFYAGPQELQDTNPSIACLARTCRDFLEPSLNALWRHQRTLVPLIRTLPSNAYKETIRGGENVTAPSTPPCLELILTRPLVQSDWRRFDYYAHRIRALGFYHNEYMDQEGASWNMPGLLPRKHEVSWRTVAQLCFYRRRRWLLPSLIRLQWNIYDHDYTDHILLFLGPTLTAISFAFEPSGLRYSGCETPWRPDVSRILDGLSPLCPRLTELEMYPAYTSDVVMSASRFAYECRQLEGYHVNDSLHEPLGSDLLISLASRPFLRKVFLNIGPDIAEHLSTILSSPHVRHAFSSLQVLYLKVPHLRSCTEFVDSMQHCRLLSIIVEVGSRPSAADVYDFFSALEHRCARDTLHVCRLFQEKLSAEDSDIAQYPQHAMDGRILRPILRFSNMRVFTFGIPMCGWLNDEDFQLIGECWTGLIVFAFIDRWATIGISPATWRGVASLVSQAPLLSDLRVTFDTRRNLISEPADVPGLRPNHQLRFFEVLRSVLPEDPGLFALSLFTIAPRVMHVEGGGWPTDPDGLRSEDPYAFREQVRGFMFRLRVQQFGDEYITDNLGRIEITDDSAESLPSEWNPWK
ncbi:hypothetical protein OH77DRAFT_1447365 [Trametes cingulata]|nr:hypothetical protein OH77DRAFT_1447365 [Trametes cingulata]